MFQNLKVRSTFYTATISKETRNTEDSDIEIIDRSLIPTFATQFQ